MSTPDPKPMNTNTASVKHAAPRNSDREARSIHKCNFRMAGLLSNEEARLLTTVHETFARCFADSLNGYLMTDLEIEFDTFEQLPVRDHLASTPPLTYFVPMSSNTMFVEFGSELVFPIVDLLMGGAGDASSLTRELSEIEEEIMQDVVLLIARHAETAWSVPNLSLVPGPHVKPSMMLQSFTAEDRLTVLKFKMKLARAAGSFKLVLPTKTLKELINQMGYGRPKKKTLAREFPTVPLREGILDSEIEVIAELPGLRVSVQDLIALQPGSVLKLRAPIRTPGILTTGGRSLFEAVPVRNGSQRAAQLGRRTTPTEWKRR